MAPLKIPSELKKITQYIRRAEELSSQKPSTPETLIVAYHCRQHAVQTGIPLATTPAAKNCLGDILTILEEHRKAMTNFSKEEKYQICRKFAINVFDRADADDRAGRSNKSTAKSFYAAASFLDVLKQFDMDGEEPSEDTVEEQKKSFYAKWKSTEILKAIKEGREVKPGGYGEDMAEDDEDGIVQEETGMEMGIHNNDSDSQEEQGMEVGMDGTTTMNIPAAPPSYGDLSPMPPPMAPSAHNSASDAAPPPAPSIFDSMMPSVKPMPAPTPRPAPTRMPAPAPSGGGFMSSLFAGGSSRNNSNYTKEALKDARELAVFALTAIDEKDGDLAVERLKQALACLGHDV
mmetsp:Transcript_5988/g.8802  ORF Transcript_5988/g.8802 Transcript_5988/m.8802 type:complete len:347 (-) Transcript_5988:2-1042(-)